MDLTPAATRAPDRVPPTWSRFRYPQSLYKYAALLGTLAFIAYALDYLNIPLERLPGMLGRMGEMLGRRYFPPNVAHIMNADYWHSVVETLQMSYLATVLGIVLSIPLAWFASFNMTPSKRTTPAESTGRCPAPWRGRTSAAFPPPNASTRHS